MRAVLLLNSGDAIASWQYEALRAAVEKGLDIIEIAHCQDEPARRLWGKHFGYYAFALMSRRGMATLQATSVRPLIKPSANEISFSCEQEGAGQRIPAGIADGFRGADVVINFGMDLLRNPDSLPVRHGVLSYHHGGPDQPKAGPAGFYELEQGAEVQGVIVQRLSDTLDGGEILATAFAPVVPYSYGRTVQAALVASIPLLAKAIETLEAETSNEPKTFRPDYHLPTNTRVARQVVTLTGRKARHLAYGLFREKRWQVGRLTVPLLTEGDVLLSSADIEPIEGPAGYSFVADCFVSAGESVYCEALNPRSGKGEIARWQSGRWAFLDLGLRGGHASYPQPIEDGESVFLFPEIAAVSSPVLYRLDPDGVGVSERIEMKGLEDMRLLDGTLFNHEETWYLFAGKRGSANLLLELWVAPALTGPYRPHPSSPVCLDPRGSRMAGPIVKIDGQLYRFGQDGTQNYGGRVTVHRIEELTEETYEESRCGTIQCSDSWGPHTVSNRGNETWIDFFQEETSALAGFRRFKGRYLSGGGHSVPAVPTPGLSARQVSSPTLWSAPTDGS